MATSTPIPTAAAGAPGVPIEVDGDPKVAQYEAAVRQAILVAAGVCTALGYARAAGEVSSLLMIAGPIAGLAAFIFGQLHTRRAGQILVALAAQLPDTVAKVKGS